MGHGDDDDDEEEEEEEEDDESSLRHLRLHLRFTCASLALCLRIQIASGGAADLIRPKQLGPCLTLTHPTGFFFGSIGFSVHQLTSSHTIGTFSKSGVFRW